MLLLVACRLAKAFPPWAKEIFVWISLTLFRGLPQAGWVHAFVLLGISSSACLVCGLFAALLFLDV